MEEEYSKATRTHLAQGGAADGMGEYDEGDGMMRNLVVVGPAPSATIFNYTRYQKALRSNDQPFVDQEWELQMSQNVRDLADMLAPGLPFSLWAIWPTASLINKETAHKNLKTPDPK